MTYGHLVFYNFYLTHIYIKYIYIYILYILYIYIYIYIYMAIEKDVESCSQKVYYIYLIWFTHW